MIRCRDTDRLGCLARPFPWLCAGLLSAALGVGLMGCGGESDPGAGGSGAAAGAPPEGGGGSEICPPGEEPLADGSCRAAGAAAGIPPENCAEGFEPDGADGCEPVLPAAPCSAGQIALPGESACRDLGSCGDAPWGDIPVDSETHHVDGSYSGGSSDGSSGAPWTTISAAVAAAPAGGLVAVAAGHYVEDVRVEDHSVRIWGRCPSLVRVTGAGVQPATLNFLGVADVEVRGLSVDGPRMGIWLRATPDAVIDSVAIADTGAMGLSVKESAATLVARELLIEAAVGSAVLVQAATVEFDGMVLRGTLPTTTGHQGSAIVLQHDPLTGHRPRVTIRRSVLTGFSALAVGVLGGDAEVHGSVIRDISFEPATQTGGHGFQVWYEPERSARASLLLTGSLVERCNGHAVLVGGSDCAIEDTVLRDTGWQAGRSGRYWAAAWLEDEPTGELSQGSIRRSLVERGHDAGLTVKGATVEVERAVVRDTQYGEFDWGRGISATGSWYTPAATQIRVISSRVEASRSVGIFAAGIDLEVVGTAVRGTLPTVDGAGYGIALQDHSVTLERSTGTVRYSAVEDSVGCGILVTSSDGIIDSTVVRRTDVGSFNDTGFGINVQMSHWTNPTAAVAGTALIRSCHVEDSAEAGVVIFGSQAEIERTTIVNSQGNGFGLLGDGVALAPQYGLRPSAQISSSFITRSVRAGVACFGGAVELASTQLECNAVDLNGEPAGEHGPAFDDRGGNVCGCDGGEASCRVLSARLQPPEPLGGTQ